MRITSSTLLTDLDEQGVFVRWVDLPGLMWGAYHLGNRTVYLRRGMSEAQEVATLAHELEHVRRGDDGHQSPAVEARIDRAVAYRLISVAEYRRAEEVTGGRSSGAIAVELGLPRWVVSAFRSTLRDWTAAV